MSDLLKLPIGIDDFKKLRKEHFFYVDKTKLIEQLLASWGEVNLFTRPRRFGKTLNMSMLRCFFEIGTDKTLFDNLYISQNKEVCEKYMGKFPVIFLSLKGVDGLTFEEARLCLIELIESEVRRFKCLLDSGKLDDDDKNIYRELNLLHEKEDAIVGIKLRFALKKLSELLCKHYGQKIIVLIDEYDVPLDKAFQHGYYKEMVSMIRGLFGETLKTNDFMQFAVLTGCLRVSKESIFTGLNNFKVLSITNTRFDEQFGFTDGEVKRLLNNYHLESHFEETKKWYDGYRFGDVDVYCPWDVINHVDNLCVDQNAHPQSYWINTSGNDLVKRFIDKADNTTKNEIERLVAGEVIEKSIRLDLTYDEIDNSINNLWSVLFTTGYLTFDGKLTRNSFRLKIPNEEIREVYKYQIQELFNNTVLNNTAKLKIFWQSFANGNAFDIENHLKQILSDSIGIFDIKGSVKEKENSYHMLLFGMLVGNALWTVKSNREAGDGFADLVIETENPDAGIIIELKSVDKITDLDMACESAIKQIHDRRYDEYLRNEGRNDIFAYGIAFYKKRCKVIVEKL